jgi:plastocyanin
MSRTIKRGLFGLALALLAMTPLLASGSTAANAADNQTVSVNVGGGEPGYSVNAFFPQDTTIHPGDTVNFKFPWLEPHMVVVDNGVDLNSAEPPADVSPFDFDGVRTYVYSGVISGPNAPDFDIKFEKAGTYKIICLIHQGMEGSVKVVDSGTVDTAATAAARGASEYAADLAALKAVAASLDKPAAVTPQAGGGNLFSLIAGGRTDKGDVDLFFPKSVNIKEGDSIKWTNNTITPHTVTVGTAPEGDPFEIPASTPAATYDGTGFWNSGIIGVNPEDASQSNPTFQMTFSKAGTYSYICLLHAPLGMTGTVNVSAATVSTPTATATPIKTATPVATTTKAPGAPSTGSGSEGSTENTGLWLIAAALGLAAAASGTAIFATRRK